VNETDVTYMVLLGTLCSLKHGIILLPSSTQVTFIKSIVTETGFDSNSGLSSRILYSDSFSSN
jgi:hypothetical protein